MRMRSGTKTSIPGGLRVVGTIYQAEIAESDLAVGSGASVLIWPGVSGNQAIYAELRNISTGGQQIRIGNNPIFSTAGLLLMPGDSVSLTGIQVGFSAIANAAGGILNRLVFQAN